MTAGMALWPLTFPPLPSTDSPVGLLPPSKPPLPKYPTPAKLPDKSVRYECVSPDGKDLGTVNATGGLDSATAACNHRISTCIIDYESSGNNDGDFGASGGCIARIQGRPSGGEWHRLQAAGQASDWLIHLVLII